MRLRLLLAALLVLAAIVATNENAANFLDHVLARWRGGYSVAERLEQFGGVVEARLRAEFVKAGLEWPPAELSLVAFKDSRMLDVYARDSSDSSWTLVRRYPVHGTSGREGPKLREGDGQVPEGIYRAESLNPNSRYHLSIRVSYPNDFDRRMAAADGRTKLGGDIMIHGGSLSIGCLAMGDEAAEDLFVLTALAGVEKTRIVIAPGDLRRHTVSSAAASPSWLAELYDSLRQELAKYPSSEREA